jgi:type II secretion system protein J
MNLPPYFQGCAGEAPGACRRRSGAPVCDRLKSNYPNLTTFRGIDDFGGASVLSRLPAGAPGRKRHTTALRSRTLAFTLLELMVAIAIFALIVATIYSTFILIIKSSKVAQEAASQAQRERIAIRTVESSLMCIQSFQASMKYYSFIVENGDDPVFSFTSRLPDVFPRNGKFGDFNVRRLTYSLEPAADQEKNLVLRQNPILMDMDDDEKNFPLVLAKNVKSFLVECWDTNAMEWDQEWDYTNIIPPLVRVTFTLGSHTDYGNNGPETTLSRIIALPCSTVPSNEQTPFSGGAGPGGGPPMPVLPPQ